MACKEANFCNNREDFMKYIEIGQDMDRVLHAICDSALKAHGMQMIGLINQLLASIKDDAASSADSNM